MQNAENPLLITVLLMVMAILLPAVASETRSKLTGDVLHGVLVFDDGNLVRRHDSLIFPHHFKEIMRYVAGGY